MKLAVLRRVVTMEEVFEVSVVDEQDEDDDEDEDVVSCKKASFPHSESIRVSPTLRVEVCRRALRVVKAQIVP